LLATASAHADTAKATAAFARGQKLYDQGKFDEACTAFEESLREDFTYGELYNLADCDVMRGHLVAALREYERLAAEDPKADRRASSAELVKKLSARVPKIVVAADARPGLVVRLDDADITAQIGTEIPVDLGKHVVIAQLPGRPERRIDAPTTTEGALVRVEVAFETEAPKPPPPPPPQHHSHVLASGVMIGGGALVTSGLVTGTIAWLRWRDNESAAKLGNQHALAQTDSARSFATASTVLCIAGVVTAAGGFVLWRRESSEAVVQPTATPTAAGLAVSGRF
jgi:tetratricopeptide (TPR) repeat protein